MKKRVAYIVLLACIMFCHASYAQLPAFLPDSIKHALLSLPESNRDSMLYHIGSDYYSKYNSDNYNRALDCYLLSRDLAEKYHHRPVLFNSYRGIASVYDALDVQLDKAAFYYKLYHDSMTAIDKTPELAFTSAYFLAATYTRMGNMVNAEYYAQMMDKIMSATKSPDSRPYFALMLCFIMAGTHNNAALIKYYEMLPLGFVFTDQGLAFGQMYARVKSKYYLLKGMKKEAVRALEDELPVSTDPLAVYNVLSSTCADLHDYAKAYKYKVLEDSFYFLKTNYNTDNNIKIKLLKTDNELQEQKNRVLQLEQNQLHQSNRLMAIILGLLLAALGIAVFTYTKIRRQNNQLKIQKQQIEERDEHNQVLLKEIHHRVKNNLQIVNSLVELQQVKPDASVSSVVKEIQTKMKSMALAHAMLYEQQDLSAIPLQHYFTELINQTLPVLSQHTDTLSINIFMGDIKLSLDKTIPLALIMNELMINTVKYALPVTEYCHIEITGKLQDDELIITYSDNGPGIPYSINIESAKTLGMRLVRRLARQLAADVSMDNTPGKLTYTFTFKTDIPQ